MAYADPEKRREYLRRYAAKNRDKIRASQKRMDHARYHADPEAAKARVRAYQLKKNFGLTEERYQEMLDCQGGVCAICRRKPGKIRLAVDHNHLTGQVRKLLCGSCNTGLGSFAESVHRLKEAIAYLEEHDFEYSTY